MAFKQLGMRRDQVLGWQHLRELGDSLGLEFKGKGQVEEDGVYGMGDADRLLFLEGLARTKKVPLQKVWEDAGEDEIDYLELDRFSRALAAFKRSRMLTDFGDMLDRWTVAGPSAFPKLDVLIVDEVQDTSNSQWDALDILSSKAEQVYVGGDDAQGIYSWSGANVDRFVGLQGAQVDLDQSWRVPRSAHKLASGIVDRIQNKRPRRWLPKAEEGAVNYYSSIEEVDMSSGDWLLLTRNGYQLTELENFCLTEGFSFNSVGHDPLKSKALKAIQIWESLRKGNDESAERILETFRFMPVALATTELLSRLKESESSRMFAVSELLQLGLKTSAIWHEALTGISPRERDYFIAARRRNEALLKRPRIRISTIHSAKGAEATNVLLLTDMSWRTHENMDRDFDAEARVWFVATTRASKTLNIVSPQTDLYFEV
jgi:DNA helicase-2/ATP-dependent DNA helicase PcrA